MKYCINCGTEIPEKAKYCGVCGTAQNESNENNIIENSLTIQSATKKCPYCAEIIKAEATVCKYCNKNIKPNSGSVTRKGYTNIVCVTISFIIEIVLIILMFVPFLNVNYDIGISSGTLVEVNVFTGFDISDLLDKITAITYDSSGANIADFGLFVSIGFLIIIVISVILFLRYVINFIQNFIYGLNSNDNYYKPIGPIVFVANVVVVWWMIQDALRNEFWDRHISVSICPIIIIIVILIILQILINIFRAKFESYATEELGWKCLHCGTQNSPRATHCEFCECKRNNSDDK